MNHLCTSGNFSAANIHVTASDGGLVDGVRVSVLKDDHDALKLKHDALDAKAVKLDETNGGLQLGAGTTFAGAIELQQLDTMPPSHGGSGEASHNSTFGKLFVAGSCEIAGGYASPYGDNVCWVKEPADTDNVNSCAGECAKAGLEDAPVAQWGGTLGGNGPYATSLRDAFCPSGATTRLTDYTGPDGWLMPYCYYQPGHNFLDSAAASTYASSWIVDASDKGTQSDTDRLCPCNAGAGVYFVDGSGAAFKLAMTELPSCADGKQNGDEQGVDCGGAKCDAECEKPKSIWATVDNVVVAGDDHLTCRGANGWGTCGVTTDAIITSGDAAISALLGPYPKATNTGIMWMGFQPSTDSGLTPFDNSYTMICYNSGLYCNDPEGGMVAKSPGCTMTSVISIAITGQEVIGKVDGVTACSYSFAGSYPYRYLLGFYSGGQSWTNIVLTPHVLDGGVCATGHTDNGDGTCTGTYTIATAEDDDNTRQAASNCPPSKNPTLASQDSAEHFFRSNALHCTAMARILILA